ncbi:hypothetical protein [Gimesia maris]|uniref:hypothetical protein n=1 Tax=Gimesia maris TaxID=122 RepID=UPI0032EB5D3B
MPYLGGFQIESARWLDSHSVAVRFTSTYTDKLYQLYAGRQLIGATGNYDDRLVIGTTFQSLYPQVLQLMAVDGDEVTTDNGSLLPERPYNRAKISATTAGWSGAKYLDVTAGTTAGGAVVDSNLIYREFFDTNRTYDMIVPETDTFHGSGTWNLEVIGRDDKEPAGNLGTAKTLTVDVLSPPPDVQIQQDGSRLTVAIETGTATVTFLEAVE